MPQKQKIATAYLRASIDPKSINKDDRTLEVVFATETPVLRSGWEGLFYEVLTCTPEAVMAERFNSGAGPVCDTHAISSVRDGMVGAVEPNSVVIKNNECRCVIRISKRDDVAGVWQDIVDGIIRNISVRYNTYEITTTEKAGDYPTVVATRWEPMEVSLVPVPADYNSKIRSATELHEVTIINHQKNTTMALSKQAAEQRKNEILTACRAAGLSDEFAQGLIDNEELTIDAARAEIITELGKTRGAQPTPPAKVPVAADPAPDAKPDGAAERKRAAEIVKACRVAKLTAEQTDAYLEGNLTADQVRAAIINQMASNTPEVNNIQSTFRQGADEMDKRREGMVNGLLHRLNPNDKGDDGKIIQPGEFRGMRLIDMAREWLVAEGRSVKGKTQREIAQEALGLVRSGGYSTSDFPNILGNVFNKKLRKAYELQGRTFLPWTTASTATDFKEMARNQIGDLVFDQVKEGGEYKSEKQTEMVEKYTVAKYGRIVPINWETIVNDDLNAFARVPQALAAAAVQKQSDVVYSILSTNAALSDSVALFHSTHKNLAASGGAIDVTTIGAGRKAMRDQKSLADKNPLNLAPKFLLCGSAYEATALQYTSQNYVAAAPGNINVWAGMLTPIVESRISGNAWYLIADPAMIDTIEYAFLDGEELFTEERINFERDAYEIKARMVFGAKAIDFRGMYKNPGA